MSQIEYKNTKDFSADDLQRLFQSVGWYSGNFPEKIRLAMLHSSRVVSAWNGERLVGIVRGMDDGVWQATVDCLLVDTKYHGCGIASELLQRLLKQYEEFLYVYVVPETRETAAVYEKNGFHIMEETVPLLRKGEWE